MSANTAKILGFRPKTDQTGGAAWSPRPLDYDETAYPPSLVQAAGARSAGESSAAAIASKTVQILDLGTEALTLTVPIPISLETVDGEVIARSYDLDLFEVGDTEGEALDGLRAMIVEFYFTLRDDPNCSSYLMRKFAFLQSIARCR